MIVRKIPHCFSCDVNADRWIDRSHGQHRGREGTRNHRDAAHDRRGTKGDRHRQATRHLLGRYRHHIDYYRIIKMT